MRQIQQISSPIGKMHRWNVKMKSREVEENTQLSFWRKMSKNQATILPWMNLLLFSSGSAEDKPSERSFFWGFLKPEIKVHFVFCHRRESLYWKGNLSISIVLLTFSRADVKCKQFFLLECVVFIVSIENCSWVTDTLGWNCKANFIGVHLVFQINFSKKWLLCFLFCLCQFITVVQRTVVKQQHLHCSRTASAPAVSVNFCNFDF